MYAAAAQTLTEERAAVTARAPRIEVHDDVATRWPTAVAGELLARLADAQAAGGVPADRADRRHHRRRRPPRARPARRRLGGRLVAGRRLVGRRAVRRARHPRPQRRPGARGVPRPRSASTRPTCTRCRRPPTPPTSTPARRRTPTTLREHGSGEFDVLMLGIGPDGHFASLFPGLPQLDVDDRIAVAVTGSPKPPPERISLTFAALNRASRSGSWSAATRRPTPSPAPSPTAPTVHDDPAAGVTRLRGDHLVPRPRRRLPPLTAGAPAAVTALTGDFCASPAMPIGAVACWSSACDGEARRRRAQLADGSAWRGRLFIVAAPCAAGRRDRARHARRRRRSVSRRAAPRAASRSTTSTTVSSCPVRRLVRDSCRRTRRAPRSGQAMSTRRRRPASS